MIGLQRPNFRSTVAYPSGDNADIISTLLSNAPRAVEQITPAAVAHFKGDSIQQTARNIWKFLRNDINYQRDPKGQQLIRLPSRFVTDRTGDCKSFSLFTYAILKAAYPVADIAFRFASYNPQDPTPTHVYTIVKDEKGRSLIIDGVFPRFNEEAPYTHKSDRKMKISVLSGTPAKVTRPVTYLQALQNLQSKVRPGGGLFVVIQNEIDRTLGSDSGMNYPPSQLQRYARAIEKRIEATSKQGLLAQVLQKELAALRTGNFNGRIHFATNDARIQGLQEDIGKISLRKIRKGIRKGVKKAGQAIKKVTPGKAFAAVKAVGLMVPRKSFLALVALNVRGLATRLSKAPQKQLMDLWKKLGGTDSVLKNSIRQGAKRKPLLGAGKKVRAVSGVGIQAYDENTETIGEPTGASTVALLAAAAPILIAVGRFLAKSGVPEVPGMPSDFEGSDTAGIVDRLSDYGEQALRMAESSGIIPERPLTPAEQAADAALPGDDFGTSGNKWLLPAAAVAAILIIKN